MLTGERLHRGETTSEILASVLKESPDFSRIPSRFRIGSDTTASQRASILLFRGGRWAVAAVVLCNSPGCLAVFGIRKEGRLTQRCSRQSAREDNSNSK
jgi:hypothetical protein